MHVLLVPKLVIARLGEATPKDTGVLGRMLGAVPEIAKSLGIAGSGYRVVINNGTDAGESVPHCTCIFSAAGRWLGLRDNFMNSKFEAIIPNHHRSAHLRRTHAGGATKRATVPGKRQETTTFNLFVLCGAVIVFGGITEYVLRGYSLSIPLVDCGGGGLAVFALPPSTSDRGPRALLESARGDAGRA